MPHGSHRPAPACAPAPAPAPLRAAATAAPQHVFMPDWLLSNRELPVHAGSGREHDLMVIFTPGHAASHLCLALRQDGLLFSGDHILNSATPVIDPPDGPLGDCLDSLDRLADACRRDALEFILPAHGWALAGAAQAIARLKAHRLRRSARVARPPGATLSGHLPAAKLRHP